MDPARIRDLQEILNEVDLRLQRRESELAVSTRAMQDMARQVSELSVRLQHSTRPLAATPTPPPSVPQNHRAAGSHETRIPTCERGLWDTSNPPAVHSRSSAPGGSGLGRARLSREERERRRAGGLCFYCGGTGHLLHRCPLKRTGPAVKRGLLSGGAALGEVSSATLLPGRLQWATGEFTCQALVDSGAEGNFVDRRRATELGIPITALNHSITVQALSGQTLPTITHVTDFITLTISGNHTETTSFYITDSPHAPVVLGHPWLVKHSPRVDWGHNTVLSWSNQCHASCLVSARSSRSRSVCPEEVMDLSNVPAEYLDLKEVFSKS
ncbi:MAG: retropepsin-like aspartic protease, partial [Plesiomonas sp.]